MLIKRHQCYNCRVRTIQNPPQEVRLPWRQPYPGSGVPEEQGWLAQPEQLHGMWPTGISVPSCLLARQDVKMFCVCASGPTTTAPQSAELHRSPLHQLTCHFNGGGGLFSMACALEEGVGVHGCRVAAQRGYAHELWQEYSLALLRVGVAPPACGQDSAWAPYHLIRYCCRLGR